jgi:hypothetical protein
MKQKNTLWLAALAVALVVAAFSFGRASATTGCFNDTNGHWAETFICWMKDEGITNGVGGGNYNPEGFVTRAQMAVFMKAAADVPPSQGQIQVVMNSADWNPLLGDGAALSESNGYTKKIFTSAATGERYIVASPTIPTAFYGRRLKFSGLEICFAPTVGSVTVTSIAAYVDTQNTGVSSTFVTAFSDSTVYTGPSCEYYTFTPIALTSESIINIEIVGNWSTAGASLSFGRATLVLEPMTTHSSPPNAPQLDFSAVENQPSETKSR